MLASVIGGPKLLRLPVRALVMSSTRPARQRLSGPERQTPRGARPERVPRDRSSLATYMWGRAPLLLKFTAQPGGQQRTTAIARRRAGGSARLAGGGASALVAAAGRIGPSVRGGGSGRPFRGRRVGWMPSGPKKPPAGVPCWLRLGRAWSRSCFSSGGSRSFWSVLVRCSSCFATVHFVLAAID